MASDQCTPTQPTQRMLDARRIGNESGLDDEDLTDIILILNPTTAATIKIVENMAKLRPEHVYYNESANLSASDSAANIEEQETIIIDEHGHQVAQNPRTPLGIALRFSNLNFLRAKQNGFVFGRNMDLVDIFFNQDTGRRISNLHFRIFFNEDGLTMLADTSTNGTVVDGVLLRGKDPSYNRARMIVAGSSITIGHNNSNETINFTVQIPARGKYAGRYDDKKRDFISECAVGDDRQKALQRLQQRPYRATMRWDGGDLYNIIGELGKGAFATVHQLATKMDGKLLAAKELEKRRFMKNGQLDKRISNEMKIMESLEHPNIIKFTEYHDQGDFLYIIMEYAPYGDLQKYLGDRGPINEDIARPLAQQILAALHYLHRAKITHRDIKPDNILISSLDPFEVKISDFGLSKIVPHAETFLKTFCGTLLYCAPEVFPDFHNSGTKRRRGVKQYNAYSQSVDVWSFGGVLWFALCGEPPFRGVADATGEGMYNNIMSTTLDPTPLRKRNVSQACIDLLTMMLTTDPSERPTELECLAHPWLKSSGANAMITADPALQSIIEEEEEECDGPEQKLSQLSLREEIPESDDESDYLSDDDFHMLLDSRQSKRVRTDPLFPRDQGREYEGYDASVIPKHVSEGSLKLMPTADKQRLFGEIGQSALQSSGVLNVQAPAARAVPQLDGGYTSASLSGTESMVRELNMTSPQSPGSGPHTPNEPATPKTPEVAVSQHNSLEYSSKKVSQDSEPTPRARLPILTRQITLPKTPSLYWDPYDKKTHTLEYASEVSGFDFVSAQRNSTAGSSVTEDTKAGSSGIEDATRQSEGSDSVSDSVGDPSQTAAITTLSQISAELNVPPRRLGRLSATSDSFTSSLVLDIDRSRISWGRLRSNTNIYEDSKDTRIPKAAFVIFWWSSQADLQENVMELSQAGKDWTELSDLHVGIFTCATSGIAVNGKHIRQKDGKGRAIFGELHTGDIIQVYHDSRSAECLKFKCEFYLGLGKEPRASGTSFMALHGTKHLE